MTLKKRLITEYMLQIKKHSDGFSLDLDPDTAFELTFDQPMFDESRAGVPFSSPISFPPTRENMTTFGYLKAMFLEPAVKELEVDICVSGVSLMTGSLIYDQVDEDGNLNYTFSARRPEEKWNSKIWTQIDPAISTLSGTYQDRRNQILRSVEGSTQMAAPPLINAPFVSRSDDFELRNKVEHVNTEIKFQNHPMWGYTFSPAFRISQILAKCLKGISVDSDMRTYLDDLAILAHYKPHAIFDKSGFPLQDYDCQKMLPDRTVLDVLQNVMKMFCSFLFWTPAGYVIKEFNSIADQVSENWSDMISDSFSSSSESETSYILGYENSGKEDVFNSGLDANSPNGEQIPTAGSYSMALLEFGQETFLPVRHRGTGVVLSGIRAPKTIGTSSGSQEVQIIASDNLFANNGSVDLSNDESDSYDCSIDFKIVRCTVHRYCVEDRGLLRMNKLALVPIIDPAPVGGKRKSEAYIGVLSNNQLTDSGKSIFEDMDMTGPISITPQYLFDRYHEKFALWMARSRQVVATDLYLLPEDILKIRMDKKVRFKSRDWLIKSIKITLSASSDAIEAYGEFVECP